MRSSRPFSPLRSCLLLTVLGLLVGCGGEGPPAASSSGEVPSEEVSSEAAPLDVALVDPSPPATASSDTASVAPTLGARLDDSLLLGEALLGDDLGLGDPPSGAASEGVDSAAPPLDGPDHAHGAGPHGGVLITLGKHHGHLEYTHNEHWGIASAYLYDAEMNGRAFDVPPVLNVICEDESVSITPGRESWDEVEDGGWHFEDDALLGVPEAGRFRLLVDGRTYAPIFEHVHVGHGSGHAIPHATGPHVHEAGPRGGYVLDIARHHAHVEVVHNANWGLVATYVYDSAMEPREFDEAPVLNVKMDDEPVQRVAIRENWDGEEDGGWHVEDDALLGVPDGGRFRVVIDGKTYVLELTYHAHGDEPGHSHGHASNDHSKCDPAICDLAPAAQE